MGSVHGGGGQTARGESDIVAGANLGVIAEKSNPALFLGKEVRPLLFM